MFASCTATGNSTWNRAHTFPTARKSTLTCPACSACTTTVRKASKCPPPPDPRVYGLPAGIDTAQWVRLDSIAKSLYDPMGGILGAYVVRTRDSQLIWSRHPDLRTLPASTMKIFAAAAALEDLGPEFRWKTQVWATGPVVKGVLKGDLVLEGGGDPTLGVDGAGMGPFVNAVARAGIKHIEGSLVALDTIVGRDQDVWPQGWSIGNSKDGYGAPVAGLNWGQNRTKSRSFPEPRRLALLTFSKSLRARKITISGTDTTVFARGDTVLNRRKWSLVGRIQSPKLSEVLRICLVHSVNPYAEASILALGTRRPNSRYAPRDQARRRFRQILTSMGVSSSVTADDGSGLSRYDLVTARAMATLLRRDLLRADGLRITDLMAKGGQGTLRYRFGRLPNPSWVSAKTGTLDGTSGLVGILRVPGRDTLAFAFLSSGYQGSARTVRGFQDRMLVALAGVDLRATADTAATEDSLEDPDDALPDSSAPATTPIVVDSTPAALDDTSSTPSITPVLDTIVPVAPDTARPAPPAMDPDPAVAPDTAAQEAPATSATDSVATLAPPEAPTPSAIPDTILSPDPPVAPPIDSAPTLPAAPDSTDMPQGHAQPDEPLPDEATKP